jgi:hypothetical protein
MSPPRLDHFEVNVPFRVLKTTKVADLLGYPLPVWPSRPPDADLAGVPFGDRVLRSDSQNIPLLEFVPPLWFEPEIPARNHWLWATLMGFFSPSAHTGDQNSRPEQNILALRSCQSPESSSVDPTHQLRHRSQVFATSQRFSVLVTASSSQTSNTHGVLPFRGLVPPRSFIQLIAG